MSANSILQVFLNADMRNGHDGLKKLAKAHDIDVGKLANGQFVIFVNAQKNKLKLYTAQNIIAYLKLNHGHLDFNAIRHIPKAFNGSGKIDYDQALKTALDEHFSKPYNPKKHSPLQVQRTLQSAGLTPKHR